MDNLNHIDIARATNIFSLPSSSVRSAAGRSGVLLVPIKIPMSIGYIPDITAEAPIAAPNAVDVDEEGMN